MISIVTLTYNNFSELEKTFNSLQGVSGIESVVVNGGECEITKKFLKDKALIHISEKDQGIADAFNKGVKLSSCDYIGFLNSGDVLLDKSYYENAQRILNSSPEISFVYSDLWMGKKKFRAAQQPFHLGKGMPFPHPSVIARKSVFETIGHFNTAYRIAMDYDWAIRLVKGGFQGRKIEATPILMEPTGVSVRNESLSIQESLTALKENGLYMGREKLYFQIRKSKFLLRSLVKWTS
jgi:GT2 family glycosyltransferase